MVLTEVMLQVQKDSILINYCIEDIERLCG
jgi:hypothetical protein